MIVCSVQDANILSSSLKYLSLYLLTVASFYPRGFPIAPEAARFLYYYSSVYLKSFKELFLYRSGEVFHSRKRMQRYSFFQHKPNISTKKVENKRNFFAYFDKRGHFRPFCHDFSGSRANLRFISHPRPKSGKNRKKHPKAPLDPHHAHSHHHDTPRQP